MSCPAQSTFLEIHGNIVIEISESDFFFLIDGKTWHILSEILNLDFSLIEQFKMKCDQLRLGIQVSVLLIKYRIIKYRIKTSSIVRNYKRFSLLVNEHYEQKLGRPN